MKISELKEKQTLSFEVFPPKSSDKYETVVKAAGEIAELKPDFMSVTCGATGGNRELTASVAADILKNYSVTPIAHLTCVSATKQSINAQLELLKKSGIENILALRGDLVGDAKTADFSHANELMEKIREFGGFCVGGACYPEGHPESASIASDIRYLKAKVDAGCKFLTTQMFFDNNIFYNFTYRLREAGITVPVIAGIMPVTNAKQIERIGSISGTYLPMRFKSIVDRFGANPKAMAQAGIAYATEQIIDLIASGVKHIHVYSMNKPDVARAISSNLSEIMR
ncbi:MAG: methylenetetrahydrofolate reductase [NAD(P)H] [Clostridia bacterium]|nr:methylenetetrahydrofolate reductase [NAD(P)H] [Clostridia bacterium]